MKEWYKEELKTNLTSAEIKKLMHSILNDESTNELSKHLQMSILQNYIYLNHAQALAAHCECLAMNAENMIAAIANISTPYSEAAYHKMMQKWELINEKGEPII
jgi:dsRNA-specific ribonuclease